MDCSSWCLSHRSDPRGRAIADRHYNRQKIGATGFVPPGRCLVLVEAFHDPPRALWVTSYPFAEYVKHAWAGAWVCICFRNEGAGLSSELITDAVACTRWKWKPPELGMITFVDASKTRHKRDPGRCFLRAGFKHVGSTKGGLVALQLLPENMPEAHSPVTDFEVEVLD